MKLDDLADDILLKQGVIYFDVCVSLHYDALTDEIHYLAFYFETFFAKLLSQAHCTFKLL